MRPLRFHPSLHRPAVSNYTRFSNVLRIGTFNRTHMSRWLTYNHRVVKNEHVLVQLLSAFSIQPSWTFNYLCEWIDLQKENLASLVGITSKYNSGIIHRDVVFPGHTQELLVIGEFFDNQTYLQQPAHLACPIVPLLSQEIQLDYLGLNLVGKNNGKNQEFAITAIDIKSLVINYWRYLQIPNQTGEGIHAYLAGYPLINARILAQRIAGFNLLYNACVNNTPYPDPIALLGPRGLDSLNTALLPYIQFVERSMNMYGIYDENAFWETFKPWDGLPVDPLRLDYRKFEYSSLTNWLYQWPVAKTLTLLQTVINNSGQVNDQVSIRIKHWERQDLSGMINNYCPKPLQDAYREQLISLFDLVA